MIKATIIIYIYLVKKRLLSVKHKHVGFSKDTQTEVFDFCT